MDNSADGLQLCARTADHRKPTGASTPPEHWGGGRRSSAEDARGCAPSQKIYEFFISKRCDMMQMKMTAICGIQKFRRREKIKHLSKYWGRQHRTTPAGQILGGLRPLQPLRRWRLRKPNEVCSNKHAIHPSVFLYRISKISHYAYCYTVGLRQSDWWADVCDIN